MSQRPRQPRPAVPRAGRYAVAWHIGTSETPAEDEIARDTYEHEWRHPQVWPHVPPTMGEWLAEVLTWWAGQSPAIRAQAHAQTPVVQVSAAESRHRSYPMDPATFEVVDRARARDGLVGQTPTRGAFLRAAVAARHRAALAHAGRAALPRSEPLPPGGRTAPRPAFVTEQP